MSQAKELYDRAQSMIRYADDASGNRGLVYGRCEEHDWRSRKRNVNNVHATPHDVRAIAVQDAITHLQQKHQSQQQHNTEECNHG